MKMIPEHDIVAAGRSDIKEVSRYSETSVSERTRP